jgi:MFS transporter, SP family, general alpha glucoside:H+ symporter
MNSVRRLQRKSQGEETVASTVSMMRLTNEQEIAMSDGTTYWDCFKGVDLRRTEVACITWACQNMCGSAFMGYSTYFYEQAGLDSSNAFTFTMIQYVLGFVGTIVAWTLMAHFGRRTLYIAGLVALLVLLVIIGGLGFTSSKSAQWAIGSLLLVFTLAYNCTVGPVCYAIVAEISSTRLRQKTVVLARMTYNGCSLLNNSLLPLQLNPLAWGWGAKDGLFWAGITLLCIVWCVFRLPESRARSYAELNLLFENKVAAWKFSSTPVDAFRSESFRVQRVSSETERSEATLAAEAVQNVKSEKQDV